PCSGLPSRDSQPGMHSRRTFGSFSMAQTRSRGAGIRYSPFNSMKRPPGLNCAHGHIRGQLNFQAGGALRQVNVGTADGTRETDAQCSAANVNRAKAFYLERTGERGTFILELSLPGICSRYKWARTTYFLKGDRNWSVG